MFIGCPKTISNVSCVEGNHKVRTALQCWFASCFMFVITLKGASHFMMQPNLSHRKYSQRHKLFSRGRVKSSFCWESIARETRKSVFYKKQKTCRATTFNIHRHTCRHVDMSASRYEEQLNEMQNRYRRISLERFCVVVLQVFHILISCCATHLSACVVWGKCRKGGRGLGRFFLG